MILRDNTLVSVHYDLPLYDIGQIVGYSDGLEASIIGIELSCTRLLEGGIVTQIAYELDNNEVVLEDDVNYFYELEDAE